MTIPQILLAVYRHKMKTGRMPRAGEKEMVPYAKEGQRKIGRWRKILWVAGAIGEDRKRRLPQMRYLLLGRQHDLDTRSQKLLKRYCVSNPCMKETMNR